MLFSSLGRFDVPEFALLFRGEYHCIAAELKHSKKQFAKQWPSDIGKHF